MGARMSPGRPFGCCPATDGCVAPRMILLLLLNNVLALLFGRGGGAETVRASLCQIAAFMGAMGDALKPRCSCGSSRERLADGAFCP